MTPPTTPTTRPAPTPGGEAEGFDPLALLSEEQVAAVRFVQWCCTVLALVAISFSAVANVLAVEATMLTVAGGIAMPGAVALMAEIGIRLMRLPKTRGLLVSLVAFSVLSLAVLVLAGATSFGHIVDALVERGADPLEARLTAVVIDLSAIGGLFGQRLAASFTRAHNHARSLRDLAEAEQARARAEAEHGAVAVAERAQALAEARVAELEAELSEVRGELDQRIGELAKARRDVERARSTRPVKAKAKKPTAREALVELVASHDGPPLTRVEVLDRIGCSGQTLRRAISDLTEATGGAVPTSDVEYEAALAALFRHARAELGGYGEDRPPLTAVNG